MPDKETTGPRVATHLDHSECDHPRTPSGRAECRRKQQAPGDMHEPRPYPASHLHFE